MSCYYFYFSTKLAFRFEAKKVLFLGLRKPEFLVVNQSKMVRINKKTGIKSRLGQNFAVKGSAGNFVTKGAAGKFAAKGAVGKFTAKQAAGDARLKIIAKKVKK